MINLLTGQHIGVLMGGISSERGVSLRSGNAIYEALKNKGYDVVPIDADRDIADVLRKETITLAFLALHGGFGENGAIQGMLEVMGIPYTGSGILASTLAMDKAASKKVFIYHGIPVPPFRIVTHEKFSAKIDVDFSFPVVVKPSAEGSSIGVTIVHNADGLRHALDSVFRYGNKAVVEHYINGKEVHIGILGNRVLGGVEVRPSLEFYSFEAKYTEGITQYIIPPEIDDNTYQKAKDIALAAHNALGCSGATRVDLIIDAIGNPFVLEINTLPGMTTTSLLPKIARSAGLGFDDLVEEILRLALERR